MKSNDKWKSWIIYVFVGLLLISGVYLMSTLLKPQLKHYTHAEIVYMFENGLIDSYTLDLSGNLQARIDPKHPEASGVEVHATTKAGERYITATIPYIAKFVEDIDEAVKKYNINNPENKMDYDFLPAKDSSLLWQLGFTLIPVILIGVFFFIMMRQSGGGGKLNQFSKANTKTLQPGKKTTFAEVAGADEEKEELCEIVEFLKRPERFNELGARIPKGVLLIGPPGTGKTLLARAVAGEAGVPFYSISGSDFVEMFVGVGASRVRDLFSTAKKNAPSIVFIDEIDAVGRHRGAGLGGGHDEREQTLNQLLVEMDGFGENTGVIIIAATNRRDILDPALLRPGRFDRQVIVGYPDVKGREEILKVHARNKPLGFDVDLNKIARTTVGFTGADLENLLNESALLAARTRKKAITEKDIEAATIKVIAGPEKKSHKISHYDKKITAYHEAGHAVVTFFCKTQDPVHEVSIIPRGMAAGYTMPLPAEDRLHVSKKKLSDSLTVLLAGRAAEEVALDDICTGASNDIERATQTARDMVTRYGFSTSLGPIVYGQADSEVFLGRELNHQRNYSENVAKEIDSEIRSLIDKGFEDASEILTLHKDKLDTIACYLLEFEKIDGATFKKLMTEDGFYTVNPEIMDPPPEDTTASTKTAAEISDNGSVAKDADNVSSVGRNEPSSAQDTDSTDDDLPTTRKSVANEDGTTAGKLKD